MADNAGLRVLVGVKRVLDTTVKIRLNRERTGVEPGLKTAVNPFDEVALEEAVRLKERGRAREVVAVSIGTKKCQDVLRSALAMGADRGVLVDTQTDDIEPINVAKVLHKIVTRENAPLTLLGRSASDTDDSQTGPMLAGLSGMQQATFVSKMELADQEPDGKLPKLRAFRETDQGGESLLITLPAVITCDMRLNQPRPVRLQDVIKAHNKTIEIITAQSLGIVVKEHSKIVKMNDPPPRGKPLIKVESADALVSKLKADGVLQ